VARKITPTHVLLNQIELSSSASSVTFSNIPQGYGDLVLVMNGGGTSGQGNNHLYFNSDTTTGNYSYVRMLGTGSATSSAAASNPTVSDVTAALENVVKINIMDYSAADKHKTSTSVSANPSSTIIAYAMKWANTSAITSVTYSAQNSGNWATGSTFSLYGVYA
jgi:hypothetical protein